MPRRDLIPAAALATALTLSLAAGAAAAPSLEALVAAHCRARAETATLRARFVQTRSIAALGEEERATGVFYYRRPDALRWEYAEPDGSFTVIRGRRGWAVFPDIRQVHAFELGGARADGILAAVGFAECGPAFTRSFDVALSPTADAGRPVLSLTPRDADLAASHPRIELALDPRDLLPRRVVLHELTGDRITLEFSELRRQVPLAPSLFEFNTPKGYSVVR